MNEEYSVSENNQQTPEFDFHSEYNAESFIEEHVQYAFEDSYVPQEFQDYSESHVGKKLSRHSSFMRKSRNRLGRLLGLLAAIAGPAIVVILIITKAIFVDVRGYNADTESLEVKLNIYSSDSSTEFNAVLTDREGNVVGEQYVDRDSPILLFTGLNPGDLYYLEVFADGESRLKLNYILPEKEEEKPGPETSPTPDNTDGPGEDRTPGPGGEGTTNPTDDHTDGPTEEPTAGPTEGPTEEPTAVPDPVVTLAGEEKGFDYITLNLNVENIDVENMTATLNGEAANVEAGTEENTVIISGKQLTPDTEYAYVVADKSGKELLSGSITTNKRTPAQVSIQLFTCTRNWADAEFSVVNPDGNKITAKFDGVDRDYTLSNNMMSFVFNNLAENSSHTLDFYDWDGTLILSYPFSTQARTAATVKLTSETDELTYVSMSFSLTNPDGNDITVKYDGDVIKQSLKDSTYSVRFDDLVSGENHTIVFLDWDGSEILSHTFAARQRKAATVSFSNVSAGYNSISVKLNVNNPDGNELELRVGGNRVNADLSSASPSANITGLNPRTKYTITVQDVSRGTTVATTTATTVTSVTWSQDGSGNTTFTLTDGFASAYPNATITVTDSLGYQVNKGNNKFYVSANDSFYSDSYTVKVTSGGSTIDTLTASLSGKTRPVIDMKYENYGPATLAEAKENGYSWISYPGYRYQLKSGYVAPVYVSDDENDFEIISGNTHWTALVIKDSTDKVVRMAITGIGIEEEKITLTGNDRITFWPLGGNYDDALVGTYTAALYTADGYTEDQMDTMFRDATDSENYEDALPVINAFTSSGRRVSKVVSFVIEEDNYKGDGYIDVNSSEVIRGEMRVTADISYYGNDDEEGFYVFVSASDPTVLLSDPVSLGTGSTYGYSIDPTYLRTTDPVYMILYTGSFSPENYLVVNYIMPQ